MRASLLLAVVLSLGVVSWAQEQERRPVSERQESTDSGAAQPAIATADGRLSQENQAAAPRLVKFSGVLLDVAGKPLALLSLRTGFRCARDQMRLASPKKVSRA